MLSFPQQAEALSQSCSSSQTNAYKLQKRQTLWRCEAMEYHLTFNRSSVLRSFKG